MTSSMPCAGAWPTTIFRSTTRRRKPAYLGTILLAIGLILSGLAIWKPVQLYWLAALMGDFEGARRRAGLVERPLDVAGCRGTALRLGQGGKWNRKQYKTDSFHRSYPFTHTTCFKVCTTSTRSLWFAITSSMSL